MGDLEGNKKENSLWKLKKLLKAAPVLAGKLPNSWWKTSASHSRSGWPMLQRSLHLLAVFGLQRT